MDRRLRARLSMRMARASLVVVVALTAMSVFLLACAVGLAAWAACSWLMP